MSVLFQVSAEVVASKPVHSWLRPLHVAFIPSESTPLLVEFQSELRQAFIRLGHVVQDVPTDDTDALFTTTSFGRPISWRDAASFQARRLYKVKSQPTIVTLVHAHPAEVDALLAHFDKALAKDPPDPADYAFAGMVPSAMNTLIEQGRRGGSILAIERVVQAQAMCLRVLLVVGDERPEYTYHFDLVGSCARTEGDSQGFYDDTATRIATAVSARELGGPTVLPDLIPHQTWERLQTPAAMRAASLEIGNRGFFTEMVVIANLVNVPAMSGAVASQYSEGCFATWEPALRAVIATITGSARPVDKGHVTDDELAVITGVREDGLGVYVRHVEGKRNDPPSSEAFEMVDIDLALPMIELGAEWGVAGAVPVVRSKLHGHRGVAAYDPDRVEFVPMSPEYSLYPVTCGTWPQAQGIKAAFLRSEALRDPSDPRQVVFTLLPTHGVFIVEKWVPGKKPLQAILEAMDAGYLQIESFVPQGPDVYTPRLARQEE